MVVLMTKIDNTKIGRRFKITTLAVLIPSLIILSTTNVSIPRAEATHCLSHCYAQEWQITGNNGNHYTTQVTDLAVPDYCSYHAEVTQWEKFSNGDWAEIGFTVGVSKTFGCATSEVMYYAYSIGNVYTDAKIADVGIGTTHTFEISDTNTDKTWDIIQDGTVRKQVTFAYTVASPQIGAETTTDSPTIPPTAQYLIQKFVSGSWQGWTEGGFSVLPSNAPLWVKNCIPGNAHITVGSTNYSQQCV